ncbi:MAG: glycine cleavage T C-terminal barrel domain-containing protein [Bryobacteraceae bacterium]
MRTAPYHALRESAAWMDLSGRGVIRVTGEDRARLLHAMTTNHIEQLEPGGGAYAFFLNAQGRILADVNILCLADALLLDTEPETASAVFEHLDRFIIADDATLDNQTANTAVLAIEGPAVSGIASQLGIEHLPAPGGWVEWNTWVVARLSASGGEGLRIFLPAPEKDRAIAWIAGLGVVEAGEPELRVVRLENAHPRFGIDFSSQQIPQETQLLGAIHFAKGCYLGQEIVERVRSRGHVNKKLVQLTVEARQPPPAGAKVTSRDTEVGEITSAAWSPALGKVVAFAYVRIAQAGADLRVGDAAAAMTARQPA